LAGSSAVRAVAAKRVAPKFVSNESLLCHFLGFKGLHGALGAQTQTPSLDYTGWISKIGDGSLRAALYDAAQIILPVAQGLFTTEELGDVDRQAQWLEQPTGGVMHRMLAEAAPSTLEQAERRRVQFGPVTTRGRLVTKCLRQDDGHVRSYASR
jgi:hypothetical protein